MRYKEIPLSIQKEKGRKLISERVSNVRIKTNGRRIEFRTNSGLLLAVLSEAELPSGEKGSKLRYRTVYISSALTHARTQAERIRRAVAEYTIK